MGWKVAANFFQDNSRFLIGHNKQNDGLSSFWMIDGAGGTFINPWERSSSFFYFGKAHPHSSKF